MTKLPPRNALTDDELLNELRRAHEAGNPTSARLALEWCAGRQLVMPAWLAALVMKAIRTSDRGKPDDLLGMGNARALVTYRTLWREGRDWGIRKGTAHAAQDHRERRTGVTKTQIIEATARAHNLSVKAVEKILYAKPIPTRRRKK